jgi:hypothetical protein
MANKKTKAQVKGLTHNTTVDVEMEVLREILEVESVGLASEIISPEDFIINVPVKDGTFPLKYLEKFGFILKGISTRFGVTYIALEVDHNSTDEENLKRLSETGLSSEKRWVKAILGKIGAIPDD